MTLQELQALIDRMYSDKDRARGAVGTLPWFVEEVGELCSAIAGGDRDAQAEEFADVLAWLATLANVCDVDLAEAMAKYAGGCPGCGQMVCECDAKA
jgi:NTP pyrophosphatase (non-canonical NTP hydrolase)